MLFTLKIKCWLFWDYLKTVFKFYRSFAFMRADLVLLIRYLFKNPYRINRKFLEKQGAAQVYAYGETPLATLEKIAKMASITAADHVLELGCGRGRGAIWLSTWIGCKVTAVEIVPEFVHALQKTKKTCKLSSLVIESQDFFDLNIPKEITVIYLYGTCLTEEQVQLLERKFSDLSPSIRIITVSYPLKNFTLHTRSVCPFPWGETDVYVQNI